MNETQMRKALYGGSDVVRAKPKKRRAKKDSFPAMEKYADDKFSLFIRARDGGCVTAGVRGVPCKGPLQCSHVERRGHKSTRYNPQGAYAQCKGCHVYHHTQSEAPLRLYAESKIGQQGMAALFQESQRIVKRTPADLKAIGDGYKRLLEKLHDPDWMKEPL
jgi:hypothetical protein